MLYGIKASQYNIAGSHYTDVILSYAGLTNKTVTMFLGARTIKVETQNRKENDKQDICIQWVNVYSNSLSKEQ